MKFDKIPKIVTILCILTLCITSLEIAGQRRERPGSMRHTDQDVANMRKMEIVVCKYVSEGHVFGSEVYVTGMSGRIKIGSADLILSGNNYSLEFDADKFDMRDVLAPQDKWKFNPWRKEKLANDFVQTGRYETFKKASTVYLRLYDGNTDNYLTDIPLGSADTQSFKIEEDGLLFEFYLKK